MIEYELLILSSIFISVTISVAPLINVLIAVMVLLSVMPILLQKLSRTCNVKNVTSING